MHLGLPTACSQHQVLLDCVDTLSDEYCLAYQHNPNGMAPSCKIRFFFSENKAKPKNQTKITFTD